MSGYDKFENETSAPAEELQHVAQPQEQPPQYTYQPTGFIHPAYPLPQQQPEVYGQAPPNQTIMHVTCTNAPPNDYFGLALFVCLCCCWPLGIVGLVKSNDVRNRMAVGDIAGARLASEEARRYSMIGLIIGIVIISFVVIGNIICGVTGVFEVQDNDYYG